MQNFHLSMLQEPPKRGGCLMIALLLITAIVLTILASCSPRVVRSELLTTHDTLIIHQRDTLRLVARERDSIFVRDSIYFAPSVATAPAGQMLIKEHTRLRFIHHRDTIYKTRRDTIYKTSIAREKTKEKTRPPIGWLPLLFVALALLTPWLIYGVDWWRNKR